MQPNLPDHCPDNVPDHRDNALLDCEQAAKIAAPQQKWAATVLGALVNLRQYKRSDSNKILFKRK